MRIIAGTAKGHRLLAPSNRAIRPTGDRTREGLFSMLMPRIIGARFLDLFCGSGANGLEALSRGAAHATFIDNAAEAIDITRLNLERCRLSADGCVLKATIPTQLGPQPRPFDILFADPPYAWNDYALLLQTLQANGFVAADGVVILETGYNAVLPEEVGLLCQKKRRRYGDTGLTFFA